MRFEDVLKNGRLWAVVYDGEEVDVLTKTLRGWMDPIRLAEFFTAHAGDLREYFHITNIDQAIYDTITDAAQLSCVILDVNPEADLNLLFRPLENSRIHEMLLSREKAKGSRVSGHPSWLRLYAIKLEDSIFLVTGGAIKLTHLMVERAHTLRELQRLESVRNYLLDNGIIDADSFQELNLS